MTLNGIVSAPTTQYYTGYAAQSAGFADALKSALSFTAGKSEKPAVSYAYNTSLREMRPDYSRDFRGLTRGELLYIAKNEMTEFFAELDEAAKNGESLESVIKKHSDKHKDFQGNVVTRDFGTGIDINGSKKYGNPALDMFWIDANTGEVMWAQAKSRLSGSNEIFSEDDDAAWDLAYDLQEFINLRFLGKTDGMSKEEVDAVVNDILTRQSHKNIDRFVNPDPNGAWTKLKADKAKPDEPEDLIDSFIKDIYEHQQVYRRAV